MGRKENSPQFVIIIVVDPDPQIRSSADPGGPKTYGSYGSGCGSGTLGKSKNIKKTLDSYCFLLFCDFFLTI
jgi:hypothetical protein